MLKHSGLLAEPPNMKHIPADSPRSGFSTGKIYETKINKSKNMLCEMNVHNCTYIIIINYLNIHLIQGSAGLSCCCMIGPFNSKIRHRWLARMCTAKWPISRSPRSKLKMCKYWCVYALIYSHFSQIDGQKKE